jgi:hypothetical protein
VVRGAIIGFWVGISLLCGCAPDLAANGAARCIESLECGPELLCYRGFCVTADSVPDASIWEAGAPPGAIAAQHDAGRISAALDSTVSDPRTAATAMSQPAPEAGEATGHKASAGDAAAESSIAPGSSAQPPPGEPPPAEPPRITPDAGGMGSPPASTSPPAGGMAGGPRGPDAGAASPEAGSELPPLPRGCTFDECCEEALRAAQAARDGKEDKKGEDDEKRGKTCGCANPALLGTVFCSLLGPWRVLP